MMAHRDRDVTCDVSDGEEIVSVIGRSVASLYIELKVLETVPTVCRWEYRVVLHLKQL